MKNLTFEQLPEAVSQLYGKLEAIEQLILAATGIGKQETDDLMNIQEAAKYLRLTVPTLYGHVSKSTIPVSKQGKRLYFSKKELTEWIKSGRKKTVAEITAEVEQGNNHKNNKK